MLIGKIYVLYSFPNHFFLTSMEKSWGQGKMEVAYNAWKVQNTAVLREPTAPRPTLDYLVVRMTMLLTCVFVKLHFSKDYQLKAHFRDLTQ